MDQTRHYLFKLQKFIYDTKQANLLLMRDVTEFQQLQEERQKVSMMKFLHQTVSHDMMSPIQNIKHFANQMLKAGRNNDIDEMVKQCQLIQESSQLVSSRMKDLLD